jgi:hypothetical protein
MVSRVLVGVRESGMRQKTFRPYGQDSLLLMPPSVRDWVKPDGLADFIDERSRRSISPHASPPRTSRGACRPITRR